MSGKKIDIERVLTEGKDFVDGGSYGDGVEDDGGQGWQLDGQRIRLADVLLQQHHRIRGSEGRPEMVPWVEVERLVLARLAVNGRPKGGTLQGWLQKWLAEAIQKRDLEVPGDTSLKNHAKVLANAYEEASQIWPKAGPISE